MDINIISDFISRVGFPIAVAAYSLVRLEKTMRENTKVMTVIATKLGVDMSDEN